MDILLLGPGSIDVVHQPDAYMALSQVQPCIDLLQGLIARFYLAQQ